MKHYDALVIGAGPAGVAAALYLARFGMRLAMAEKLAPGGLLLQTFEIENYPGFPQGVKGYELADSLAAHLEPYDNITRIHDEITEFIVEGDSKRLLAGGEWISASAVIIASGVQYRKLGLPNEEKLLGRGISHCALCDGNFFKDQPVAVVGGGNSAVEETLHLAKIVSHVHLIHRRDEFRAAPLYLSRLKALPNVSLRSSTVITSLHGEQQLEGLTLKDLHKGTEEFLSLNGLFIFVGFEPAAPVLPPDLKRDRGGFIETDTEMRTNLPGVFAAGDIRSKLCRQVVTAVGDGATAANSAYTYLEQQHG